MNVRTHKFKQNDMYILVDVNSGAVHVIDEMIYDMMDDFDGTNDDAVIARLAGRYPAEELREAAGELHELMAAGALFAPDINVPPTFKSHGLVKSLCLMVAQDCNLRCKYCFGDGGCYGGHRAVMSPEVGCAAVDFIVNGCGPRKHCEIDFFGGEPLMNLHTVKEVTAYVRKREQETGKEFKLTLTTNGMLLSDKNIAWLNDNNISVVLSSDGRREVHDAMRPDSRGNGTYDVVMRNFRKLVEARGGNDYYLRGTYTRENMDFTKDVLAMNEAGFDILSMEPVVLKDSPLGFTEEDLPRIFAEYDRLTETYLSRVRAGKGFFFFHFNMDLNHGPCVAKRLAGCGAGHEYYAVAENGDLYPCHQFVGRENYRLGSVFTGVENTELPTYFRNSHVLNKPLCRDCWARFYCSGGRHAERELLSGGIPDPGGGGCAIQKKRLECAILVQAVLALEKEAAEEAQEDMRKRA